MTTPTNLKVVRCSPDLPFTPPTRQHESDCGYDLYVAEDTWVREGEVVLLNHNIRMELSPGMWGLVIGRSSSFRKGLTVAMAVIDNGYRGLLYTQVASHASCSKLLIRAGDRVSQLVIMPMVVPKVEVVEQLGESSRGSAGFGSTGE